MWSVSFSLESMTLTSAILVHNGQDVPETHYGTNYGGAGVNVWSTGGRSLLISLQQGDTLNLRVAEIGGEMYRVLACFEFLPTV